MEEPAQDVALRQLEQLGAGERRREVRGAVPQVRVGVGRRLSPRLRQLLQEEAGARSSLAASAKRVPICSERAM